MSSPASILLLGSTDLTLAVATRLHDLAIPVSGVVSADREFAISYSSRAVRNTRHVNMRRWCREHHVPFQRYREAADVARIAQRVKATLGVLVGWYHIVPAAVRRIFPRGCLGVHASLLPRYRGGAPLNWALLNGDAEAGVSLFELRDGVDDGPLYAQRRFAIGADDYIGDLVAGAEAATLELMASTLPAILAGSAHPSPQEGEVSYSLQRQPEDGVIDWGRPASAIARLVRSVSRPYPGATTRLGRKTLTIWRARAEDLPRVDGLPGQIVRLPEWPQPAVVTGAGLLVIEEIEGAGGFGLDGLARAHQRRLGGSGSLARVP